MVKQIILISIVLLFGASAHAAEKGALKDPLRPLGFHSPKAPATAGPVAGTSFEWRLGAVLISAERSVAVINGKALQVGELLNGYTVKTIETDNVVLLKNKKKLVLRRSGTGLKKAVPIERAEEGSQQ